jgi:predicted transcriptional regulator
MTTITLKLPESLDRALGARARRQNRTKSALVREALVGLLAGDGKRSGATFSERAGDLAGRVAGPRDLSHGKRHRKGFGL